jgi:hypothetical protein
MLEASTAETGFVISRGIKLLSFACCGLVVLSFVMFARDQMAGASVHQQTELSNPNSAGSTSTAPSKPEAQPGRFINSAAKTLTSPFDAIVRSSNAWVRRGLPTIVALLVYGLGLGYLGRYSSGLSRR